MGFDIAMEKHSWSHLGFILFSIVSSYSSFTGLKFNYFLSLYVVP